VVSPLSHTFAYELTISPVPPVWQLRRSSRPEGAAPVSRCFGQRNAVWPARAELGASVQKPGRPIRFYPCCTALRQSSFCRNIYTAHGRSADKIERRDDVKRRSGIRCGACALVSASVLGRLACLDFGADILITRDIRMCPVGCARELNRLREPMQPLRPHVCVAAQDVQAAMGQRVLSRIGSLNQLSAPDP
jgi:hypothetical protein